jgi:hypothetical protein
MPISSRRKFAALLLTAALVAPWAAAAEPCAQADQPATRGPSTFVAHLWAALTAVWGEEGCSIDPYGRCGADSATPAPTENLDEGCKMDPFGGCREGRLRQINYLQPTSRPPHAPWSISPADDDPRR